jgi:endo-1,4-beta-xylanase
MKFALIHPGPSTYSFGPADSLVAFAAKNGMVVRGHTMVWHRQNPAWITNGSRNPAQLAAALEAHIKTVVGHYAGQVYAWDVVNEAFNEDGTLRSTVWSDSPGIGLKGTKYIEQAFQWARQADGKALLFYNDYNTEGVNPKSDAVYEMASDFKSRGVPLDGVGLQMHLTSEAVHADSLEANLRRLTALGLQVQITELDVRLPVDAAGNASADLLVVQAQIYREVVATCLKFPQCTAIQTWGFTDRYSWVPKTFRGTGAALQFDVRYKPKPAFQALLDALK